VTVVILFGIMFTQRPQARRYRTIINRQFWAGLLVAAGVGLFLSYVLAVEEWRSVAPGNGPREVAQLGRDMLGVSPGSEIFALLFQVVSVLLLVAIVAAIVVSRRKVGHGRRPRGGGVMPQIPSQAQAVLDALLASPALERT
jgi:NADH:ubiquinone oxidoreductase subunit 6 (subunit J)